jgi:alpha-L-fucosidase
LKKCANIATILTALSLGISSPAAEPGARPDIWKLPTFKPASGPYRTTWTSVTKYRTPHWYRDVKFGYWAHWDPQTVPESGDWFAMHMYTPGANQYKWTVDQFGNLNEYGYKDICNLWKGEEWDPDAVMKLCVASGSRYFWALGNHHDNFDCWDSRYQPWNSMNVGPKKDVVGTWAAAARRYGLPVGVSIHTTPARTWGEFMPVRYGLDENGRKMDGWLTKADGVGKWWEGLDPVDLNGPVHTNYATEEFKADVAHPFSQQFLWRVDDLITKHKPDILWFDDTINYAGDLGNVYLGLGDTMALHLTANYFNRMAAAGKSGALSINGISPKEANASIMTVWEDASTEQIQPYPWQCLNSMGPWHFDASNPLGYHSDPTSLMQLLVRCSAANGNLVVGIPIRAQGDMYTEALPIFKKIGEWLKINGEGIYSARPYAVMCETIGEDKVYYTRTVGRVYAFASKWPGSKLVLPGCSRDSGTIGAVSKVELLAGPRPISCTFAQDVAALTVTLPRTEPAIADIKVYAFRITHGKTWTNDDDSGIFFHGWEHEVGRPGAFNNDWNHTSAAGDMCRLAFSGTGIEYIAEKGADFGNVMVTLDNGPAKTVSLKGSGTQQVVYTATGLPAGDHALKLVCQGNGSINVDAIRVLNGRIKVKGFNVAAIGVDAINLRGAPRQNSPNPKPKAKIEKIKHVEVP